MADGLLGIPRIAYAKAQVNRNKSFDVSKLDVSFGGFTPMPLNDGMATREQVLSTEARIRERREAALRAQALQDACTSDSRHFVDDAGTDWEYVVLSGSSIRHRALLACGRRGCNPRFNRRFAGSLAGARCLLELRRCDVDVVPEGSAVYRGLRFRFCKRLNASCFRVTLPPSNPTGFVDAPPFRGCACRGFWKRLDQACSTFPILSTSSSVRRFPALNRERSEESADWNIDRF